METIKIEHLKEHLAEYMASNMCSEYDTAQDLYLTMRDIYLNGVVGYKNCSDYDCVEWFIGMYESTLCDYLLDDSKKPVKTHNIVNSLGDILYALEQYKGQIRISKTKTI